MGTEWMEEVRQKPRRPTACILCEDERLVRGLTLYLEDMGWEILPPSAGDTPDILLVDADTHPAEGLPDGTHAILFSRRAAVKMNLPDAVWLHRPLCLEELRRELWACLPIDWVPYMDIPPRGGSRRDVDVAAPVGKVTAVPDGAGGMLHAGDRSVRLTPAEWGLYTCLLEANGQSVSREQLAAILRSTGHQAHRQTEEKQSRVRDVNVFICYLRRKLETLPGAGQVATRRGEGYALILPRQ